MDVYGDGTFEYPYPGVDSPEIDVGSSSDGVNAMLPVIQSITQQVNGNSDTPDVALNGTGTLQITGTSLEDQGTDPNPSICVNGSCSGNGSPGSAAGLALGVISSTDTSMLVSYTVDGQASSVGPHNITVTTVAGTSNTYSLTVWDPTPAITVNPGPPQHWEAANSSQVVTITGMGLGTSPQLSIVGTAVLSVNGITNQSTGGTVTSITATVSLSAAGGAVAITVTTQGYGGPGGTNFLPSDNGHSNISNEVDVTVDPAQAAPAPTIVWGQGGNVCQQAAAVPAVVVGQRIAITGCLPAVVSPANVSSQSWSYPAAFIQNVVAGYNPAATNNQQVSHLSLPIGCDPSQTSCSFPAFFPVSPGSPGPYTLTYTYVLNNGGGSGSVSVALQVAGPTATGQNGAFFTATPTTALDVWPAGIACGGQGNAPALELGDGRENVGIAFRVTANPPAAAQGSFLWVQLINNHTIQYRANPAASNTASGAGLDNWFPYETLPNLPNSTNDSPGATLSTDGLNPPANSRALGEVLDTFSATMYLLWDPAMNAAGQTGACAAASNAVTAGGQANPQPTACASIPVPVGYITWSYSGNAINTLANQANRLGEITTWVLGGCGAPLPGQPAFTPSTSYPTWNTVVQNVVH